jgi:hypothetical protein
MGFMAYCAVKLICCICEKSVYLKPFVVICKIKHKNVKDGPFFAAKKTTVFFLSLFFGKWYRERYP